jgi:rRNA processing protein Krr1/Pno1
MPRDYDRDDKRRRERSRTNSRDRRDSYKDRRDRKKETKWSDAPVESSRFSHGPSEHSHSGGGFDNKSNFNALNNQLLQQHINAAKSRLSAGLNYIDDNSKLKRKIYIPKTSEINYVGLLIGPKGTYQKRLEQQTGCKILIRGKGTQKEGNPPQPDDHEEKHVLVIGDSEEKLSRAQNLIERVLFADEKTRIRIKEEQIKASQDIRHDLLKQGEEIPVIEDYMLTPYGPPDKSARIVPVPNDCVGLIIGKNGETIRRLNRESGCKVQIAIKPIPNTEVRNVFIEGPTDKYELAKKLIEEIVSEQITLKEKNPFFQLSFINSQANIDPMIGQVNPFPGPHTPLRIPNKMVGLIIGRNGETVKTIHEKTKCFIFIPKDAKPGEDFRELQLSGPPGSVELCKREIISMIHLALYGRLPYMNSLFYPFLDPVTGLPIIDPNTLSQLDPNTKINNEYNFKTIPSQKVTNDLPFNMQNINYNNIDTKQNNKNKSNNLNNYDLNDYDNPMNYDLYFQSLYQMYPHMNDYTKSNSQDNGNPQYIICNNGFMEENRAMYDPNYIVSMFSQTQDNIQNEKVENINSTNTNSMFGEADFNRYIDNMYNQQKRR